MYRVHTEVMFIDYNQYCSTREEAEKVKAKWETKFHTKVEIIEEA